MSRTFGILSPFVGGDYYGAIIAGVNGAAVAAGDRVMAVQTLDPGSYSADRSGLPDFRRPVAWQHLAGLIVLPGAVDAAYARSARLAGRPVVLVGHEVPDSDCSSVLADSRSGVREAVADLAGHGHERIAFAGNLAHFDVRERHEGYREELLARQLTPRPDLLFDLNDNHETGGESVADALIRAGMPATAVVTGTDRNAIGLIRRLAQAGYEVPGDLAVVGFDDIADGTYLRPSLSTVRQPLDALGAAVHALARELAADPGRPAAVRLVPTTFVQRDSCGCPSRGLPVSEARTRELFSDVRYLQATLNVQYELGIELLGAHENDPRGLAWMESTPAVGGCLGLWRGDGEPRGADPLLDVVGEFRAGDGPRSVPVSAFPPPGLFTLADGPAGDIVFVVPVRSASRDWGALAAVGRIQASTPPGREMMNQAGALLAAALDRDAMVASLRDQEERLRNAALHDHLTGLPNRVLLADRLQQAGLRAARQPGHRFAVLLLDLDGFKAVNDSLGHAAGDILLVEVARRLTGLVRQSDTVARLGGDEFVVLLDGFATRDGHERVRDAITAAITEPFVIDGCPVEVGLSIGVALSTDGSADPDHLLREADAAMYREKSTARRR
ncbi:substrate-binding and GGDEF domain-containing protein [Actinoplanes auranticolor]|uniref:substrate-binding and GGDEF domain-containing protein n=1 Tax=Actinoplanes auranticolor TaxID=47988 RepID=UPI001BB3E2D1|nr:GGDEF domain-containing protein [Actinoplanes auranticolor]